MVKHVSILIAVLVLIFSVVAEAKELYVDQARGNDLVSYEANTYSNPWRSIERAAWGSNDKKAMVSSQAAAAGDTVYVTAGTYTVANVLTAGSNRWNVAYETVNSGSSGHPITFKGVGKVILQTTGIAGPVIGSRGPDYIIWDSFYIDEANVNTYKDTGPVVVTGADYCQILNVEIKGKMTAWNDNHNGIRLEGANNTTIRNCKIYDVADNGEYGQNSAAVMMYDSNDSVIENNEFYNCGVGVFIKGIHSGSTQDRNIVRKNLIHNMGHSGIRLLGSRYSRVYQNIIQNSLTGVYIGFFNPTSDRIVNNTIVNNIRGITPQGTEMVDVGFYNNIIVGGNFFLYYWQQATPSTQDMAFNYNLYYSNDVHARYNSEGSPVLTIDYSTWKSTWRKDVNGINGNPQFVNPAGNNFRLQSGSPALMLGLDILNLSGRGTSATIPAGAYITGNEVIGRIVGAPSPSPGASITPPTGLRIQ